MKKVIFILCVLLPILAIAQNCKYDKDEYDKFQKVRKTEKEVKAVKKFNRGNGYLDIILCKYGDNAFFRLSTASSDPITVGKKDAVIFLLGNDETVKAYPDRIYFSDNNGARFLFYGTYQFDNPSDFDKIKKQTVKSIRLYFNSVYRDYDLNGKGQESLMDAAKCF